MVDQITPGVRISVPPAQSEIATPPRRLFPLAAKLLLIVFLCLLVFIVIIFLTPFFQTTLDRYLASFALAAWALCVYGIFIYFYVHPLHIVLDWFHQVRAGAFKDIPPAPVQSSDEIGHLVQEMSAAISMMWQSGTRERELLQHKSDTITLIEHQLRTALTSLRWSLEGVEVPEKVSAAVVRISGTVQDIINAARIGEGTFGYVFGDIDIVPIVEKVIASSKPRAESRGVALTFEHEANIPQVKADADRLGIAISNILSNAIEYTPKGGTVSVSVSVVDHNLDVSIKDTGIGMSQEDIGNMFVKMYRGKDAMKMRPDGSGLGLYVAKNILNEHHAEVMVRSEAGKGTQFSFRLPIQ